MDIRWPLDSNEDAHRQKNAPWHSSPSTNSQHSILTLPYNSPHPCYSHPPNTVSYYQDKQLCPVTDWVAQPLAHRVSNVSESEKIVETQQLSCETMKRKQDGTHHGENNKRLKQNLIPELQDHDSADFDRLTYRTSPPVHSSERAPYLPGVAQYLQYRDSRNDPVLITAHNPASPPGGSTVQARNQERTHSKRPDLKLSPTVWSSQQPSKTGKLVTKSMNGQTPVSSQPCPESVAKVSTLPRGTQHDPLEIFSSPEPDSKHSKTANTLQATHSEQRGALRPAEPMKDCGFSGQESMGIPAGPINAEPKKTRYYAVAVGHRPGVFKDWSTVEELTKGFPGAKHKKFGTEEEALAYFEKYRKYTEKLSMPSTNNMPAHSMPGYEQYSRSVWSPSQSVPMAYNPEYNSMSYVPVTPDMPSTETKTLLGLQAESRPVDMDQGLAPPYDGPKLVPEQQHVIDLIVQGHNVFYTGSAGCGKSTILNTFVKQLKQMGKRVKIVAPTNLAALNVGGQTTWNFAGWTPDSMRNHIDQLMENARGNEVWKRFDETDVLVIDEISMIENLQFERLNMVMKASRGQKCGGGAFGGVQIIVTGDFYQLAPVKPFHRCMCGWELEKDSKYNCKEYKCKNPNCREHTFYDLDKWAFRSNAWKECNFKHVNLTQIHRQSDMMFKSILNRIRTDGKILKPHANVLLNHTSETEGAITLFARRIDVDRVNNQNINKIPSAARTYKCLDDFDWPERHRNDRTLEKNTYRLPDGSLSTLKEHRFETQVQLKQNQRVVLQSNIDPAAGLVNGAQGTIIELKTYDAKDLPKVSVRKGENGDLWGDHATYREAQIEAFGVANGHQPWPVVQFTNGVTRTIFADCTVNLLGNEEPYCKLSRTQIPLVAGYAITVHKSQGMTLDRVTVDLARAFEPSQIYVALSRARSLKGLTVTALPRFDLGGANVQVKEFMENFVLKRKAEP